MTTPTTHQHGSATPRPPAPPTRTAPPSTSGKPGCPACCWTGWRTPFERCVCSF